MNRHPFVAGTHPSGLFFGYGAVPLVMSALQRSHPDLYALEDIVNMILALLEDGGSGYDVTHGLAGIGIAANIVASMIPEVSYTINLQLEPVALEILDYLEYQAQDLPYGFAHGLAGIGYFFLLLYANTDWSWAAEAADKIAHQILDVKIITPDGSYAWPKGRTDATVWTHWCHGSAGIGTFLLSAGHILSEETFRVAGLWSATGIARHHGFGSISLCHGFPGDLDFILDVMKEYPSNDFSAFKDRSLTILQSTVDPHHSTDRIWLWPSEGGTQLAPSLMTGYVGVHSMLLRAKYPNIPRLCGLLRPVNRGGDHTWISR